MEERLASIEKLMIKVHSNQAAMNATQNAMDEKLNTVVGEIKDHDERLRNNEKAITKVAVVFSIAGAGIMAGFKYALSKFTSHS